VAMRAFAAQLGNFHHSSRFLNQEMKDFDALEKRRTIKKILESDEDTKTIEAAVNRINGQLQNFQVHFDPFLCSTA
jgi:arginyl-tRNA synthetase